MQNFVIMARVFGKFRKNNYLCLIMTDICCIGHITEDHIITPGLDYFAPGGTAYYFAVGINSLITTSGCDLSFSLITKEGRRHFFENKYSGDMNGREQRVLSTAEPFTSTELAHVESRYIVLGSLLADDFPLDLIRHLSSKGVLVLDVQGFLREVRDCHVHAVDWVNKVETLRYVDVLKVNEYEMEVLTGSADPREAALRLADWGVKEVLLTFGSFGSLIYDAIERRFYDIPAYSPLTLVDATGCGDTYVMAYVFKRAQGATIEESGHFAAAVSTLKLQDKGPFRKTYAEAISMSASRP